MAKAEVVILLSVSAILLAALVILLILYIKRRSKKETRIPCEKKEQTFQHPGTPLPLSAFSAPVSACKAPVPTIPELFTRMTEAQFLKAAGDAYVAFDFKTTGLCPIDSEIVEVGGIRVVHGVQAEIFNELVKPSGIVPPDAVRIHGITSEMVAGCRAIAQVMPDFLRFIGTDCLIAHNASFEVSVFNTALKACCLSEDHRYYDSLLLARKYYPSLTDHKLSTVADFIGSPMGSSHRTNTDCKAICDIVADVLKIKSSPKRDDAKRAEIR